jgi:hypothetical protein
MLQGSAGKQHASPAYSSLHFPFSTPHFSPPAIVNPPSMWYACDVEVFIEFNKSAFRHGVSKEDIRCALVNWKYDEVDEDDPEKNLLLGFDRNANLLEIMYNVIDEHSINVFHAMKCQSKYYHLLNPKEK